MLNDDKPTVWVARCDHLGDLIITLPLIAQMQKNYAIKIIVEPYIYDFANHFIKTVGIVLSSDFLKITHFSNNDIFVPFSMSKAIRKHTKKYFLGARAGYVFRSKDWFYATNLSTVYRANKTTHEAELLRQFALCVLPFLKPLTHLDYQTNWLLEFGYEKPSKTQSIAKINKQIIFHPGSNGNGREWPGESWAKLIELTQDLGYDIYITGRTNEARRFMPQLSAVSHLFQNCIDKDADMIAFAQRVASADLVVSSGTGPAHLAASMGVAVITLYPPIKTAGRLRWHPLGSSVHCLASSKYDDGAFCKRYKSCDSDSCPCMTDIKAEQVASLMHHILCD